MAESECNAENTDDVKNKMYINPKWRSDLLVKHHSKYCLRVLLGLPSGYEEYDSQRLVFLHFVVGSLDLMKNIDILNQEEKRKICNWVYHLYINADTTIPISGFQGYTTFIFPGTGTEQSSSNQCCKHLSSLITSHITMTYSGLIVLLTLGDDLSRLDRQKILKSVGALQNKDGSFLAGIGCTERDMRFIYCAVAVCYMLNDFSFINTKKLTEFIKQSFTYEGAFHSGYGREGHAAYTFCAVSSLVMMNTFHESMSEYEIECLKKWCLFRQSDGFNGRPNKCPDSCYSWWIGATLKLVGSLDFCDKSALVNFILSNQNPIIGGIGKHDNENVDPLHTFMSLAGLSLLKYEGLGDVNPALSISETAFQHLKKLQALW